jgi:hypothetical protein
MCTTSGRALRTSHALTANTLLDTLLSRNTNHDGFCEETVEDENFLWKAMENAGRNVAGADSIKPWILHRSKKGRDRSRPEILLIFSVPL